MLIRIPKQIKILRYLENFNLYEKTQVSNFLALTTRLTGSEQSTLLEVINPMAEDSQSFSQPNHSHSL